MHVLQKDQKKNQSTFKASTPLLPTENIPLINATTNKISSNNNKPTKNISNQASYADIINGKTNHAQPMQKIYQLNS